MAAPSWDVAADSGFAAEGTRREPAEQVFGGGVLSAPPLPLKPTVSPPFAISACGDTIVNRICLAELSRGHSRHY